MSRIVLVVAATAAISSCASATQRAVVMHGGDPTSPSAARGAPNVTSVPVTSLPVRSAPAPADGAAADTAGTHEGEAPAPFAFVCPMHPHEGAHEPGRCPVCGMALRPVRGAP